MINFKDATGRKFTIIDCSHCGTYDQGDILPMGEAVEFLKAYPAPHFCLNCTNLIEEEVYAVVEKIARDH